MAQLGNLWSGAVKRAVRSLHLGTFASVSCLSHVAAMSVLYLACWLDIPSLASGLPHACGDHEGWSLTIRGPALLLLFVSRWSLLLVALSPWGPSSLVADAALLLLLRQESRDSESRVWAGLQPLSKVSPEEAFHRSVSRLSLFLTPHPQLELCHHTAPSP